MLRHMSFALDAGTRRRVNDYLEHVLQHIGLAGTALIFGVLIGGTIGLIAYTRPVFARPLLGSLAVLRVIPSLAILLILLPWLGIGRLPVILALILLASAPIAVAVESGLRSVAVAPREAAMAMGMSASGLFWAIEWPLALPAMFAGVRTAGTEAIASASLAAFAGGGGLGEYLVEGLSTGDTPKLLEGAITIAALAWLVDLMLAAAQRRCTV
jgi:osmoprotectant transport system permease protein